MTKPRRACCRNEGVIAHCVHSVAVWNRDFSSIKAPPVLRKPHPISTVPVSNPTTLWVAGPALRSVSQRHQLYRIVAAALQAQQHVRATQWRSRRRLDLASDRFATVRGCVRRRSRGNGDPVRTQGEIHTADDLLCSVGRAGHTSKLCVLRCATKRMKAAWADGRLVLQLSCLSAVVDKRCV